MTNIDRTWQVSRRTDPEGVWGWIGALVFLILLFYGVPRVQSMWNIAGMVFGLVMTCVSGAMAYRAHRHIRRLIDQLGNA